MTDTPPGGRSPGETVRQSAERLNRLLARTVTQSRLVTFHVPPSANQPAHYRLTFRQSGRVTEAQLRTRFGPMNLFIGRTYALATDGDGTSTLRITTYRYTLTPTTAAEPLLRWEYVAEPADPEARWSRHHLQGPIPLRMSERGDPRAREATLNDLHLPTGWVPIEEVLRFCIVDLGARPLSDAWQAELEASYGC
jgi:hypothetical protein